MTLSDHIDAIAAILAERHDAEAERIRAWLSSLPASSRALTDRERDAIKRSEKSRAAGDWTPGDEMSLRLALRGLREKIAPAMSGYPDRATTIKFIDDAMVNAADYIHDRRLYVAPPSPRENVAAVHERDGVETVCGIFIDGDVDSVTDDRAAVTCATCAVTLARRSA